MPTYILRQEDIKAYVLDQVLGAAIDDGDRDFRRLLATVARVDNGLSLDLEAAHNDAVSTITEAAFIAGLRAALDPLSLLLEPVADQGEGGDHARR